MQKILKSFVSISTIFMVAFSPFTALTPTVSAINVSPTIFINKINGEESPFNFTCPTNPLFSPVTIEGNGESFSTPGNLDQYYVSINWGDGSTTLADSDFVYKNPDKKQDGFIFTFTSVVPHTYISGNTYSIQAFLYHQNPSGNDNQEAVTIPISVCVVVVPACTTDADCNDGAFCNGTETCFDEHCVAGAHIICSDNDVFEIATCDNDPDNNPFTWDYRGAFTSTCDESVDACTIFTGGDETISHNCSITDCQAQCDDQHPCAETSCEQNADCVGNDLYTYENIPNICEDCFCTINPCGEPIILEDDPSCGACFSDEDCNSLNDTYCSGSIVITIEGVCNETHECTANPSETNCDNGLVCDGQESCSAGACVSGTAVNCLPFNINEIATCDNNPDNNPFTWDFRDPFTSVCQEPTGTCSTGNDEVSSTCSTQCGGCAEDIDCDDDNSNTNDTCNLNTCQCSHTQNTGTLTVIKTVINDNGGMATSGAFTMNISGNNPSPASFPGDASGTTVILGVGLYGVWESGPSGYNNSSSTVYCGGNIVSSNDSFTCTVTNDDIAPKLTVIKHVVGGTATASDFTITVEGTDVSTTSFPGSETGTVLTLDAGQYAVSETTTVNYTASSSADCSGTIMVGEEKTCTITNTFVPQCQVGATTTCQTGGLGVCATGVQTCGDNGIYGQCVAPQPGPLNCSNQLDNNCNGTRDDFEQGCQIVPFCGDGVCNGADTCGTCPGDCGTCGGGGGGGGGQPLTLFIINEVVAGVGIDNATINWNTNIPASSRVVYTLNPLHSFNWSNTPNFGYDSSNTEDPTTVAFHTMTLTGLLPSTTYYVRSYSQIPTSEAISTELTFTTLAIAGTTTQTTGGGETTLPPIEEEVLGAATGTEETGEECVGDACLEEIQGGQEALADVGAFSNFCFILLLIIILLTIWHFTAVMRDRKNGKKEGLLLPIVILLLIIWALWQCCNQYCWLNWTLLGINALIFIYSMMVKPGQMPQRPQM